ncbi:MAG: HYR domain-containing protein [Saprospirales bacterium]|nr:HYR domain-containing protein [Saprospirales bacterium]
MECLTRQQPAWASNDQYSYTDENGCSNSCEFEITVNPLPEVTCPEDQSVCVDEAAFLLTGGSPEGGEYSGTGVSDGMFDAAAAGVGVHTIVYSYTDENGCSNSCQFEITVNPIPNFTFTATTTNGSSGTGNTDGGPNLVTIYFCPGEYFSFSGYSSVPGTQVGYLEEIPSGTDNVTYNGNAVTVPRAQQDFGPASAAALFSGPYGPYDLSSGTSGSLVQTYTAYYDADNSGSYTDGDCLGETITLVYHINATPLLETTINSEQVTSNNDGVDDTGSFSVCNTPDNILFNSFVDLNGLTPAASVKAYQTLTLSNVTVPFCNNCAASLSAFSGVMATASLVNPALPGTLVMSFRAFLDIDNDNVIDAGECAGDWVVYTITVNPLPEVTCPEDQSVCVDADAATAASLRSR